MAGGGPLRGRSAALRGALKQADVRDEYARHCLSFVQVAAIPRLKVVLDTANGMGAVAAEAIFAQLPVETVRMFFELDGTFPNHPADPLLEENRRDVVARVLAERADLGIAWDGDADRCFFIDDRGEYVPGDFITAILGEAFAQARAAGEDRLRRAGLARGRRSRPGGRRRAADEPGRPRLHQEAHARREGGLRRRGLAATSTSARTGSPTTA